MTVLDALLRRMADTASLILDSEERDAACGDLAESRESGLQVLREVLVWSSGGVQLACEGWRPWLNSRPYDAAERAGVACVEAHCHHGDERREIRVVDVSAFDAASVRAVKTI